MPTESRLDDSASNSQIVAASTSERLDNNIDAGNSCYCRQLSRSKTITALNISSNYQIRQARLVAIAEYIFDHPTLTALNMNKTSTGTFSPVIADSISRIAGPKYVIDGLSKRNGFSCSDICTILTMGVAVNKSLRKLYFGANNFRENGPASAQIGGLETNRKRNWRSLQINEVMKTIAGIC